MMIVRYLINKNLYASAETFMKEMELPNNVLNYIKLKHFIVTKDFGKAVVLVQKISSADNDMPISVITGTKLITKHSTI